MTAAEAEAELIKARKQDSEAGSLAEECVAVDGHV